MAYLGYLGSRAPGSVLTGPDRSIVPMISIGKRVGPERAGSGFGPLGPNRQNTLLWPNRSKSGVLDPQIQDLTPNLTGSGSDLDPSSCPNRAYIGV